MTDHHKRVILAGCVAATSLLLVLAIFRRDISTAYVASRFDSARTPTSELEAAKLMNHWAHTWTYGYMVETEDALGNDIRPWSHGNYGAVATVTVTWDNGTKVHRSILNRDSLTYIFGE